MLKVGVYIMEVGVQGGIWMVEVGVWRVEYECWKLEFEA